MTLVLSLACSGLQQLTLFLYTVLSFLIYELDLKLHAFHIGLNDYMPRAQVLSKLEEACNCCSSNLNPNGTAELHPECFKVRNGPVSTDSES